MGALVRKVQARMKHKVSSGSVCVCVFVHVYVGVYVPMFPSSFSVVLTVPTIGQGERLWECRRGGEWGGALRFC